MWNVIWGVCVFPALFLIKVKGADPTCSGAVYVEVDVTEPVDFVLSDLNLICTDPDAEILNYVITDGNTGSQFKVEGGELKLAKVLPVEIPYKHVMQIDVTDATPTTVPLSVTVVIRYNDNNNAPAVTGFPPSIPISESTHIGTLLATCTVTDADEAQGTLAGQTRVGLKYPYGVLAKKWVLDSLSCELFLNTILDYEHIKSYNVTIIAWDLDPISPKNTTQVISINVLDENDNPPRCTEHYKLTTTTLALPIGTELFTLNCTDVDSGSNGVLAYEIDVSNTAAISNMFEVDPVAGILKIKTPIVSNTIPYYDVLVKVKDSGATSMQVKVLVRVVVTGVVGPEPVNNFNGVDLYPARIPRSLPVATSSRTSLTSTGLSIPYCELNGVNIVIAESQLPGVDIYDLKCTDPDGDVLDYAIIKGDTYSSFEIQNGVLRITKPINGDFTSKLSLHITVTDQSASKLSTSLSLGVYVRNENDNTPVIKDLPSVITISENEPIGTIINSCSINDKDRKQGDVLGGQTRVGWQNPSDPDAKKWILDPMTCDLYVNTELDYESVQSYNLVLISWDLDDVAPFTVSSTFTVLISDYNDNSPVCPQVNAVSVPENTAIGTILATVTCTDVDEGDNSKIYFKIDDSNSDLVKSGFTVGGTSGIVKVQAGLDFETTQSYDVAVIAYDGGIPSLSTTTTVQVTVTDIADGAVAQNTSTPAYAIKPTVKINVIQDSPARYDFICDFPLSTDPLYYMVNWYIDGNNIFTTPRISSTSDVPDLTKLTEAKLLQLGVTTVGFNIGCGFRASFAADFYLGLPSKSDERFIGIKVLTPDVTLKQGEEGVIKIQATAPIGCNTAQCDYPIYTFLQQNGYDCAVNEGSEACGVNIDTTNHAAVYDIKIKGGITFQYGRGVSTSVVKLRSPEVYADHPMWAKYELDDVTVNIEQDTALIEGSKCSAFVDPRIVTFDRGLLNLQEIGVYTLYSHPETKTEVQIKTYKCDEVTDAHCVCGVVLRTGKTVYRMNDCGTAFTELDYTICDDASPDVLKVEMLEKFYQVYLPTGTRVKIFIRPTNMNVYVYPSVMDIHKSGGLCGNLTGNHKDDLVLKDGQRSTEKVSKAKYEITPIFFNSWKVAPADDLFNVANYGPLTTYTGGLFVYNNDAYTCSAIGGTLTGRTGSINNRACNIFTDVSRIQTDAASTGFRVVDKTGCTSGGSGRRKRSVPSLRRPETETTEQLSRHRRETTWKNGWTEESTHEFCNQLFNESSMVSLCKDLSLVDVTSALIACYQDIELTGSANFSLDTMSSIRSQCIHEINSNDSFKIPEIPGKPPTYDLIIAVACPGECSKMGNCIDGKCVCNKGYGGMDCSVDITETPLLVVLENDGYCDVQMHTCHEISAFGETFVTGEHMSCRTKFFELKQGNKMEFSQQTEHKPFLESISEAICKVPTMNVSPTPDGDVIAYGYEISLTNDGIAYSRPNYMAIYNSECQSCNIDEKGVTCSIRANFCVSGGVCYKDGEAYKDNKCFTCQSNSSIDPQWIRRDTEVCIDEDVGGSKAEEEYSMLWLVGAVFGVGISLALTIVIILYIKRKNKISSSQTELDPEGRQRRFSMTKKSHRGKDISPRKVLGWKK